VTPLHIRLLVRSDGFAGVERYLTYLAPELAGRGHTVSVVGGEPALMRAALTDSGVTFTPAATTVSVGRAAMAHPRPDLLHSHMTAADAAGVAASIRIGCPVVSTLHFAGGRGHSRLTRAAYGAMRSRLAREIAVSSFVASGSRGHPIVLPTGIPMPKLPHGERQPIILVAQRLEPEKQTAVALQAWSISGLADDGWSLLIAGQGSQEAELRALAAQLDGRDRVRFVGHEPDLAPRLAEASMLMAPTPHEAFGLTVVEAMASALPVVAAAGGGHLETVGPASPDTLFPPGDADAAAKRLRELADAPASRSALGAALRARFEAEFTIEHHVDRLEALYHDVVSDRTGT
jgi:glycosyltransferase involved in cell wall biosynthesis